MFNEQPGKSRGGHEMLSCPSAMRSTITSIAIMAPDANTVHTPVAGFVGMWGPYQCLRRLAYLDLPIPGNAQDAHTCTVKRPLVTAQRPHSVYGTDSPSVAPAAASQ